MTLSTGDCGDFGSSRQTIMQGQYERYRISRGFALGSYYACIGAFVYEPGEGRVILDTWTSKEFPTVEEREEWVRGVIQ